MSRRTPLVLLSSLLLIGVSVAVSAQDEAGTPMWLAAARQGANDVTVFGDEFVVVGGTGRVGAKVWTSADGATWARVPDDDSFEGAVMRRVAAGDDAVVALGDGGRRLVGWSSTDGASWQRTTIDRAPEGLSLFAQALTHGPAGFLAVASEVGQDLAGQHFYRSSDGRDWSEVDPPMDASGGIFVALESTDDEYLAVARQAFTPGTDLYWRSSDGTTWEPFDGPTEGSLTDIVAGADGAFVGVGLLGEEGGYRSAIWRADELGSWEFVYSAPSAKLDEERLEVVRTGGPGFVAAGSTSACPTQSERFCPMASILVSEDGREWSALGVEDGVPGPMWSPEVHGIAENDGTTVLVVWNREPFRPEEVWTQPAG
jgi:photosystem II stability/assembly factor-like uncharacterized protein